jgi:hypothetical protein
MGRKNAKKVLIMLKVVMRFGLLTSDQQTRLNAARTTLIRQNSQVSADDVRNEIAARRQDLAHDKDLQDIFEMFWYTMRPYVDPITLAISKEGYIKLNTMVI